MRSSRQQLKVGVDMGVVMGVVIVLHACTVWQID